MPSPSHPATHGLPIPRATTAAWDVMPPCAVSTPCAWIRPWMSSGVVSQRTSTTASPALPRSSAVSASSTIAPEAAPGDALSPVAATSSSAAGSIVGWSSWSSWPGSMRATASSRVIRPSSTISSRRPQRRLGRPLAGAGLEDVQRSLLDGELDVLHVAVVLLEPVQGRDELLERARQPLRHARDRLRRADPRDDVLALCVDEELAVEDSSRRSTGRA